MNAEEFVDIVAMTHSRSSCSDMDTNYNGWMPSYKEFDCYPYRCKRCLFLQIARGEWGSNELSQIKSFLSGE